MKSLYEADLSILRSYKDIWVFDGGEDSSRGLLGYDAVWCCDRISRL